MFTVLTKTYFFVRFNSFFPWSLKPYFPYELQNPDNRAAKIIISSLNFQHEITGRALLRMTDNSLLRMGIENNREREAIWREIVKLRLKTDIMEIKDFELMNIYYE